MVPNQVEVCEVLQFMDSARLEEQEDTRGTQLITDFEAVSKVMERRGIIQNTSSRRL